VSCYQSIPLLVLITQDSRGQLCTNREVTCHVFPNWHVFILYSANHSRKGRWMIVIHHSRCVFSTVSLTLTCLAYFIFLCRVHLYAAAATLSLCIWTESLYVISNCMTLSNIVFKGHIYPGKLRPGIPTSNTV
jgi:hypothetical protein